MKNSILLFVLVLFGVSLSQESLKVQSKVSSATVFRDRAMVKRTAECSLQKGESTLVFSNLTPNLDDASVRVNAGGPGEIKIIEVKVERRFTSEIQDKAVESIQAQIRALEDKRRVSRNRAAVLEQKEAFIESLKASTAAQAGRTIVSATASTAQWADVLLFVETNLSSIYREIGQENLKIAECDEQIEILQKNINQITSRITRDFKEIIVNVETQNAGLFTLTPSYIVPQAGWLPTYDARVFTDANVMQLSYFGMVHQATGEDWQDVELTLSTVDPIAPGSLPEPGRWFVDTKSVPPRKRVASKPQQPSQAWMDLERNYGLADGTGAVAGYITDSETGEPLAGANVLVEGRGLGSATDTNGKFFIANVPAGTCAIRVNLMGYTGAGRNLTVAEKFVANFNMELAPQAIQGQEVVVTAERPSVQRDMTSSVRIVASEEMKIPAAAPVSYVNVHAKELSTTFEIPKPYSIPSDNSQHKVTIAIESLPIELAYVSFPDEGPSVFLKGKIVNTKDYQFLAGNINVFVDDDFVNTDALDLLVPSDTLALALGIDERIQAKKVLLNSFTENRGLLKGNKKITFEYEIRVVSRLKTLRRVMIHENIPISMHKDIKIELLKPLAGSLNEENQLRWDLELEPGKEQVLPLVYSVEFPANTRIFGLE